MLIKPHHLQDESCEDIDSLAVADGLVVPGVGQQDPLQHTMLLLCGEPCGACTVEILGEREGGEGGRGGREGGRKGGREGGEEGGRKEGREGGEREGG